MLFENAEFNYIGETTLDCKISPFNFSCEPEQSITNIKEHQLHITYPLSKNIQVKKQLDPSNTYTLKDLLKHYVDAYTHIYNVEELIPIDDPKCLNMGHSNGTFGIWGHKLDDLYFESIQYFMNESKGILYTFISVGS